MGLDLTTVSYMAFNFLSSIGIIFVNKLIFKQYNFHFATFVTSLHFVFTWLGLSLGRMVGMYEPMPLRQKDVLPISFAFCIHIIFNNLSLQYNSIGFYQLMKVLTTPMIAFIQEKFFGVPLHNHLKLALLVECIGVGMATVTDVTANPTGTFYAVAGLLGATYYQIFVKTKQKSLNANSWQVLHYQAPQSLLLTLCTVPIFDQIKGPDGLIAKLHTMNTELMIAIVMGSSLAFCVNLSVFLVIGRTSPISYNVLGHFKLCVVLVGGILLFGGDTNPKRMGGMALTFAGVVLYTTLKQRITENWDKPAPKNGDGVALVAGVGKR